MKRPFASHHIDTFGRCSEEKDPDEETLMHYVEILPETNQIGTQKYEVTFRYPGVFFFQFKYNEHYYTDPQYIQVDPELQVGDQTLNVSSLRTLTILARSLGKMDRWEEFIYTQRKLGYNVVHFTPIQQYGESGSHYSLADQLNIDDWFFEDTSMTKEERFEKLKYHISKMQIEAGMLFFVDIVLNHTAGNSEWIKRHPEATYNTDNCKHLMCAYVLDKALTDFDIKFSQGETPEFSYAPYMTTEEQLNEVMWHISEKIINPLKIYEFFLFNLDNLPSQEDIQSTIDEIYQEHKGDKILHGNEDLNSYVWEKSFGQGEERFGVQIDMRKFIKLLIALHPDEPIEFYANKIKELLESYNHGAKAMAEGFMDEAKNAVRGEIRYHKLELRDPKIRKPEARMITSYFRELDNEQKTKCVHNGWSMGGDASKQDFCAKEGWFYLRRYIIAWGDSVKLRYGERRSDSKYLWDRMSEYVTSMGQIFDGVRLDNAHSTPKHIAKYMLQKLRSANPNTYVLAEFFTNSRESEAEATRELGINGLIREMQNYGNCKDLSTQCHMYGG